MIKTNIIHNENCLDTMSKLPNCSIDLVVTSPPYEDIREYYGYYYNFNKTADELYRVIKDNRIIVWIVGDIVKNGSKELYPFNQAIYFKNIGFKIYDIIIYNKNSFLKFNSRYTPAYEYMFILSKGKPNVTNILKTDRVDQRYTNKPKKFTRRNKNGVTIHKIANAKNNYVNMTNVWKFTVGYNNSTKDKIAFKHSAIFPEKLCERHILSWSNEGDIVYDCFMGSGTTAKMCILNNRKYIGSEISKEYCSIAEKRIEPYKMQTVLNI